jgi:hypothetical protein
VSCARCCSGSGAHWSRRACCSGFGAFRLLRADYSAAAADDAAVAVANVPFPYEGFPAYGATGAVMERHSDRTPVACALAAAPSSAQEPDASRRLMEGVWSMHVEARGVNRRLIAVGDKCDGE